MKLFKRWLSPLLSEVNVLWKIWEKIPTPFTERLRSHRGASTVLRAMFFPFFILGFPLGVAGPSSSWKKGMTTQANGGPLHKRVLLYFEYFVLLIIPPFALIRSVLSPPQKPPPIVDETDRSSNTSNEKWFFVNGICTDQFLQECNAKKLSELINRPLELVYNPTHGLWLDMHECIMGRTYNIFVSPDKTLHKSVTKALKDPSINKVGIICHSQGGIIVNQVLQKLNEKLKNKADLEKIEVYTFASAQDEPDALYTPDDGKHYYPFIEHFANEKDPVSQIGILYVAQQGNGGPLNLYVSPQSGHNIESHYLDEIVNNPDQYNDNISNRPFKSSRFYSKYISQKGRVRDEDAEDETKVKDLKVKNRKTDTPTGRDRTSGGNKGKGRGKVTSSSAERK